MKVKRLPEDFVVEELSDVQPLEAGKLTLYSLEKRGIGTLEAIQAIQQRWKLNRYRMSWGGLKDRHAITKQYFTVAGGPKRGMEQTNFRVECLGYVNKPFEAHDISGNRFSLVLRNLTVEQASFAVQAAPILKAFGVPNYFDDQRFGSVSLKGEFIADPWIRGNYERSLWLTFAEPNSFDNSTEKREKAILREHWGDWKTCKEKLTKSHRRSIITFLNDRPGDFKGAWGTVNKDLRSLYLAAFQSQIWNETLSLVIERIVGADRVVPVQMKTGKLNFPVSVDEAHGEQLAALKILLPSARVSMEDIDNEVVKACLQEVLASKQLELREIRTKFPRDSFFSKGSRSALSRLGDFESSVEEDDMHSGRKLLRLRFDLQRGAYATIVIKRLGLEADLL